MFSVYDVEEGNGSNKMFVTRKLRLKKLQNIYLFCARSPEVFPYFSNDLKNVFKRTAHKVPHGIKFGII
jgi:hypothetical protein